MARDSEKVVKKMEVEAENEKPKDLFRSRGESVTQGVIRGIGKL